MTQEKIMWGRVAALVVVIVVVAAGAFVLLRRGPTQEGQPPTGEEYVWVQYTASFKLLSTSDNGAIENLRIEFPYPHVAAKADEIENATSNENMGLTDLFIRPHQENITIYFLAGTPAENGPTFISRPPSSHVVHGEGEWVRECYPDAASSLAIPRLALQVSQLHLNDEFRIEAWVKVSKEKLQEITLLDYFPENLTFIGISSFAPNENRTIGATINTEIYLLFNSGIHLLENWGRVIDSGIPSFVSVRLFRST